jgi:polar amino acid transport system permease protein
MFLDWRFPFVHINELLSGALLTIEVSIVCFLGSLLFGTLCSIVRFSKKPRILYLFVTSFVEIMRNTPLLVQLFFTYFGLPQIGIFLNPLEAGVIALTANSTSYYSEIMRAGIQSIPKGQWEASASLGISKIKTFTYVILPQVIRDAFPSIANQLVLLIFGTSVLSILDVRELTQVASILNSQSFRSMELFTFVMVFYYGVTALILNVTRLAFNKWFAAKSERR